MEQFLLQSGTTFIPKCGKKLLTVQIPNERNRGNRFWQSTHLFTSNYLVIDTLPQGILGELKLCYNQKKEEMTPTAVKQLLRGVSCTEN